MTMNMIARRMARRMMMTSREEMPGIHPILRWQRLRETISSGQMSRRAEEDRERNRLNLDTSRLMRGTSGSKKSQHRTMLIEITRKRRGSME